MSHLLLQSKLELRSNKRRSKESGSEGEREEQRKTEISKTGRQCVEHARTAFCVCVCVRMCAYTYLYVCMFAFAKYCALRKSKRRATEAILITRMPREVRLR